MKKHLSRNFVLFVMMGILLACSVSVSAREYDDVKKPIGIIRRSAFAPIRIK